MSKLNDITMICKMLKALLKTDKLINSDRSTSIWWSVGLSLAKNAMSPLGPSSNLEGGHTATCMNVFSIRSEDLICAEKDPDLPPVPSADGSSPDSRPVL